LSLLLAGCGENRTLPGTPPYAPGGDPAFECLPNLDGALESGELPIAIGEAVGYLVGESRPVDLEGTVDAAGRRTWSFAIDYADDRLVRVGPARLSHRRPDQAMILNARADLHPGIKINREGAHLSHRRADIVRPQASGQNQWPGDGELRQHRPVKNPPGAASQFFVPCIEKKARDNPCVRSKFLFSGLGMHRKDLDHPNRHGPAILKTLLAMQLDDGQAAIFDQFSYLSRFGIDKNPHRIDKGRQIADDLASLIGSDPALAFVGKDEAQGIHPDGHCVLGILQPGDAADLETSAFAH